jgi:phosphohistidine phosphatase
MLLYVMRHGPAEDSAPSGRDFDRRLTVSGRELVAIAARRLHRARSAVLPRIVTSPLVRARQTTEIVHNLAGAPGSTVEIHDSLEPRETPPLDVVEEASASGVDTLLIGHQPSVESLVRSLVRQPATALSRGFRTAMIVALMSDPMPAGAWTVSLVLDPHELESD